MIDALDRIEGDAAVGYARLMAETHWQDAASPRCNSRGGDAPNQ